MYTHIIVALDKNKIQTFQFKSRSQTNGRTKEKSEAEYFKMKRHKDLKVIKHEGI